MDKYTIISEKTGTGYCYLYIEEPHPKECQGVTIGIDSPGHHPKREIAIFKHKADADAVVLACNNHDKLVEAVRKCHKLGKEWVDSRDRTDTLRQIELCADAVLTDVEKEADRE